MNCFHCGANNPDGALYCGVCGTIFPESILKKAAQPSGPYPEGVPPAPGPYPPGAVPAYKKAWFWLLLVFVALPVTVGALRLGIHMSGRGIGAVSAMLGIEQPPVSETLTSTSVPDAPPARRSGEPMPDGVPLDELLAFLPITTDQMAEELGELFLPINPNLSIRLESTVPEGNVLSLSIYSILDGGEPIGLIRSSHDPDTGSVYSITMEYNAMASDSPAEDSHDDAYRAIAALINLIDPAAPVSEIMRYEKALGGDLFMTVNGVVYPFFASEMPDPDILTRYTLTAYREEETTKPPDGDALTFGDTFIFADLELTFTDGVTWDQIRNEFSEHYGKTVFLVPITIKNIGDETQGLELFTLFLYGPDGLQTETPVLLLDDSPDTFAKLRPGATYETQLVVIYTGDGDYYIELNNYIDKKAEVRLPVYR